jgi:hypothetical protein
MEVESVCIGDVYAMSPTLGSATRLRTVSICRIRKDDCGKRLEDCRNSIFSRIHFAHSRASHRVCSRLRAGRSAAEPRSVKSPSASRGSVRRECVAWFNRSRNSEKVNRDKKGLAMRLGEGRWSSGRSFEKSAHLLVESPVKEAFLKHNSGTPFLHTSFSRYVKITY